MSRHRASWSFVLTGLLACANTEQTPSATSGDGGVSDAADPVTDDADRSDAESAAFAVEEITMQLGAMTFDALVAGPKDGEPVLLLHGFPETAHEWSAQITFLAEAGYRVLAPNQRGYSPGARPADVSDYNMVQLLQDTLAIADAQGFQRFHLVGHDWGASVGWVVGGLAPQRLLSLTTISVPHPDAFYRVLQDPGSCQPAASRYVNQLVRDDAPAALLANDAALLREMYAGLSAERVRLYLDFFAEPESLRGGLSWYRANMASDNPWPTLGRVNVPTLHIWSDGDTALCRDGAVLTGEYVSGPYRFEVLEGVNHWVPELAAERLNALLLEQLQAYPRGQP